MTKKSLALLLALTIVLASVFVTTPVKADLGDWLTQGWNYGCRVELTETAGVARIFEPVDIFVDKIEPGYCANATKEIRIVAPDNSDVPRQVYNITTEAGYVKSFNVVFLANVSALDTAVYHVIYNKTDAQTPEYLPEYGLNLTTITPRDAYNITAFMAGVEYNYFSIPMWKNPFNLYSGGKLVTNPGLWPGWGGIGQINLATMWSDAFGVGWFGGGKLLTIVNSGPIFVDINYTETIGQDLFGTMFDWNVSTNTMLRVYYQPNLNPLVRYHKTFHIKTNLPNYTISSVFNLESGLMNSTGYAIYASFTWKDTASVVTTVSTEAPPITDIDIWSPASPIGWWSYNGSRPDSAEKPAANIGFIPTHSGGTITGPPTPDYTINLIQALESDRHRVQQWFKGTYNGFAGDILEMTGYIVTYKGSVDIAAEPVMEEKATKLRNPLEYTVGEQFEIPEFPFMGALMILVLLTTLAGLRKLPTLKRLK